MISKLQERREALGLNIHGLVVRSGISKTAISRIESHNNPHNVSIGVATALARALKCEVEDLFDRSKLSNEGRPPHTGTPLTQRHAPKEVLCTGCFELVPANVGCDSCGQPALLTI